MATIDPFGARDSLGPGLPDLFRLESVADRIDLASTPVTVKILLENLLRHAGHGAITPDDVEALVSWRPGAAAAAPDIEIPFMPARVILQDFTGVPAIVDLAVMRDAMAELGGDPARVNPLVPADLVIDHSVQVDRFGTPAAFAFNVEREYERNGERYQLLRWAQTAFRDLRVVPPGTGIVHQVNLEYLATVVTDATDPDGEGRLAYPDTLVGTDSHTTMINGLGVLGYGVGGIEAEAVLLGQPLYQPLPRVVGVRLHGELPDGSTATDLVLVVTELLRRTGVVGAFVEFAGDGLAGLSLADRATISNMSPEFGATATLFPIDDETLVYLRLTGRSDERVALIERYAKEQGLWRLPGATPAFDELLELDLATVTPSVAGPRRPQDRVTLPELPANFVAAYPHVRPDAAAARLTSEGGVNGATEDGSVAIETDAGPAIVRHGSVAIAAITSCTNTSNPSVMLGAGLVAKKAVARGLKVKPFVKTSLAPGSRVVTDYLEKAGLIEPLGALGFNVVGYGCTTCIGNSGPLPGEVVKAITSEDLVVAAVLSGNRNFEGRIHPYTLANYLASPPLVVAYALAGTVDIDLFNDPLGEDRDGNPVYLREIWPTSREIQEVAAQAVAPEMFREKYANVFTGNETWNAIKGGDSEIYGWEADSTYIQEPPFFTDMTRTVPSIEPVRGARVLALLGDSLTTDHISPAGAIPAEGPAGKYLQERGVSVREFNTFGSRRGNHEVMMRGTFANIRLRNRLAPGTEGGWTRHQPSGEVMPIYDAAMKYKDEGVPLVVVAGREYGTGSSRDWAAKGTRLLGVKAVIVESFERIHRSNLVGMGVLPLEFKPGVSRKTLRLDGTELFDISGIADGIVPRQDVACRITRADGSVEEIALVCRIDTLDEVEYFRHGGILQYVLRKLAQEG